MPKTLIKPASGMLVRDPSTMQALLKEGAHVQLTSYWRRRIKDGDVTVELPTTPTKKKTKE